jgi:RNA-binding protein
MATIDSRRRRELRARAHHLRPLVAIGEHGLTAAVLHEIDVALAAHELVKIRASTAERAEREAMLERVCEALDAAPVQHLGKLLIVWRQAAAADAPADAPRRAKPARARSAKVARARPATTVHARHRRTQT